MIDNQPRELTLIYHSEKSDDKKARGYVESLPTLAIKTLDLAKEQITETQLAQLADKLEIEVKDLIDPSFDERENTDKNKEGLKKMDKQEMLTYIKHNPKLLSTPILIIGDRAFKYGSAYELIKEYQSEGVKMAGAANKEEKQNINPFKL
jgi:arsenate reductase-like glutaredoxin family protein